MYPLRNVAKTTLLRYEEWVRDLSWWTEFSASQSRSKHDVKEQCEMITRENAADTKGGKQRLFISVSGECELDLPAI